MTTSSKGAFSEAQERLLEDIQAVLDSTDLSRWRCGGEELDGPRKWRRQQEIWEHAYAVQVGEKTLVLRSTQDLDCEYVSGGFQITPHGEKRYRVELREAGFNPKTLSNPSIGCVRTDSICEVLLEGELAEKVFLRLNKRYKVYLQEKQRKFKEDLTKFLKSLPEIVTETPQLFVEEQSGEQEIYRAEIDKFRVELTRAGDKPNYKYSGTVTAEGQVFSIPAENCSKLFEEIDSSYKVSKLEELYGMLKKIA
ncbi:MAG: hypothetical protein D6719_11465 [Candidatus Dadabacteria bacterium]|nr:MAG: hypothetical protein D6719_11465 [Candidatus Dadabacteria bacterium]